MCQQEAAFEAGSSGRRRRSLAFSLSVLLSVLVAASSVYGSRYSVLFIALLDASLALGSALLGSSPKDETLFDYDQDGLPLCNGCHCTPHWDEDPNEFICPALDQLPPYQYSSETIEILASQKLRNVYKLDCNPYVNDTCDTVPSLERGSWGKEAVCGITYDVFSTKKDEADGSQNSKNTSCPLSTYTIRTYQSPLEAAKNNAIVTHFGPCGVCSTTQDLATYMRHPDMVDKGRRCSTRLMLSHSWEVSCYQELGFTRDCAHIWVHNSNHSATLCMETCLKNLFVTPNGPEPHCRLNDCLHCDEVMSGPNFQLFAGRTRRNSGLRTPILRQCDGLANIHHDACPLDGLTV